MTAAGETARYRWGMALARGLRSVRLNGSRASGQTLLDRGDGIYLRRRVAGHGSLGGGALPRESWQDSPGCEQLPLCAAREFTRLTWGTNESSDHLGFVFMYRARDTHKQLIACVGLAISE